MGIKTTKKAEDRFQAVNFATTTAYQGKVFDITASQNSATTVNKIEDAIFEINGKKFATGLLLALPTRLTARMSRI